MAAVLESRKAIFVKYVGLEECDRQSVDAVIIYVSDEDTQLMTFSQLDEITRPKRYRGINANSDMLTSDLLAVRLENSSLKGAALIDTDAKHRLQIAFDFLPNRAIIWFQLNAYSEKKPIQHVKIKETRNENTGNGKHRDENQSRSAGTNMLSNLFGPNLSAVLGLPMPQPLITKPIVNDPRLDLRPIGAVSNIPRSPYKNGSSKNISSTSTVGMKQTEGTLNLGIDGLERQPTSTQTGVVKKRPQEQRDGHGKTMLNSKTKENLGLKEINDNGRLVDDLKKIRKESSPPSEKSTENTEEIVEKNDEIDIIDENMIFSDDDCDEMREMRDVSFSRNNQNDKMNNAYFKNNTILDTTRLWNNQPKKNLGFSDGGKDNFENLRAHGNSSFELLSRKKLENQNIATILDTIIHDKLPTSGINDFKTSTKKDFAEIIGCGIDEFQNCNISKIEKRIGEDYQANLEESLPLSSSSSCTPPITDQDSQNICLWEISSRFIAESDLDKFLNNLKKEQLNSVRDGDFLWDFSFLPENYGNDEISVDSPKSSRQLTITGKQKFICVLNNSKYNTKTFVSAGNDDDVSELLVFDGVKEYTVFSNQCEPVYNLSYYILPEERALQILMENKGDYAKALNICRSEIQYSRDVSGAVHATLRTQRKNNSFHGNLSISVPIPATASNPDSDGNIMPLNQTLHCNPSAILFSKLHSNLNLTDNSVSPDLKKSSDNVRTDIDELVYSNTSSASSANSYGYENNDGHHGKNINRGEDVVCDDGVNYMISTEIAPSNIHENTQDKKDIIFEISSSPSEKAVDSNNRNQPINLCDDEEENEEFENCAIIEKISRLQDEKDDITALHDSTTFQLRNQSNDSNDEGNAMVTSDPVHTSDIQIRKEDQFRTKDVSPRNINEWILRRRWTSNVFKMLLPALIEHFRILKLGRVLKMVNRSQFGTDIVGTADLIYLYYLFGESYFRSQADSRLVKDVIRQPSWASALLSVVQKSSSLLSDKRRKNRPPNSANLSGITSSPSDVSHANRDTVRCDPQGLQSALSTFKPVTKLSSGETQALSSNGRILKSGKAKFVNFDSNVKDSTGPLVLKDPADSKMGANNSQVPHSVRELFTDKSHNAKFSIVDLKYDCCKATTTYLGLTFEGTKGSYKRVTEYIGTNKSILEVGDVLLSIDNNDVQQMSLCGMRSFLMRLLREKILYCENAILKEGKYTFKRRYLRLKFRRTSVNDAAAVPPPMINNSYEIPDQSTQNVTKLPGTSSSNKRKQHSPHKSETGSGESFEIIKKRKYSRQNAAPKMSEEEQKEAEFDEAESCNDDDVEDAKILERKLTLMNRIQPTCRIFWNEHPAEVLTINREQFALEVRWSSNKVNWIEIEPDRIQLQEDLVMSSRSTRH